MSNKKSGQKSVAVVDSVENVPDDGLLPQERAFVAAFVKGGETGGHQKRSAIAAGYSERSAGSAGALLMTRPRVIAAVDAALRDAIGTRLTVKAVAVIEDLLDRPDTPLKLRGEMAARVIEFSGLVERTKREKAVKTGFGEKTLGEMTRDELQAVVAQGAAVLKAAGQADRTIEGVCAPISARAIDVEAD